MLDLFEIHSIKKLMILLIRKAKNNSKNSIKINSKFVRFDSTSRPIGKIGTFRCRKLVYLQRVHYGSELRFSGFSLILKVSGKERRRSLCYWFLFCLPSHHSWCQSPWGFDTLPLFTGIKFDNYFYYTTLLIFGWKGSPFQEGQWLSGGRGGFFKKWVFRGYKKAKWQ